MFVFGAYCSPQAMSHCTEDCCQSTIETVGLQHTRTGCCFNSWKLLLDQIQSFYCGILGMVCRDTVLVRLLLFHHDIHRMLVSQIL